MNRRGFLLGLLSSPASAALLPKTLPEIGPPYVAHLENIPFNLYPGAVNYVDMSAIQQKRGWKNEILGNNARLLALAMV